MFIQVERSTLCRNSFIDILNGNIRLHRDRIAFRILDCDGSLICSITFALIVESFVIKQCTVLYINRHCSRAVLVCSFLEHKNIRQILVRRSDIGSSGQGSSQSISQRFERTRNLVIVENSKRANRFSCCRIFIDRIFIFHIKFIKFFIHIRKYHGNRSLR